MHMPGGCGMTSPGPAVDPADEGIAPVGHAGDLEARAAQVEQQVTQQIQVRADVLERRAEGLCKQVQTLDGLENSLGRFDLFSVDGPSI